MQLYFAPLACSLASRASLYEAGIEAEFIRVDTTTKKTADGGDFLSINSKGQVPTLRTDDGDLLTENTAILEYIADSAPAAKLAPAKRPPLREWLSFVSSELHTPVFGQMLSQTAPAEAKAHARATAQKKLAWLDAKLDGKPFLLGDFTVADAYLATVMNWTQAVQFDLAAYPNVAAHRQRVFDRPASGRAFQEEFALYRAG